MKIAAVGLLVAMLLSGCVSTQQKQHWEMYRPDNSGRLHQVF